MYKIKENPEDFVVEEIPSIKLREQGEHSVFLLTKQNITTQEAIFQIRKRFHLRQSDIGYAGSKDKRAVTKQLITLRGKFATNYSFKNFKLDFLGFSNERLLLGNLIGNKFLIKVKDVTPEDKKNVESIKTDTFLMPNYFGPQRFSINNVEVGELLLKRNFEDAVELVMKTEDWFKTGDYLKEHPNDFLGALRLIPRQLLKMYIHSFQSKVFNEALSDLIKDTCDNTFSFNISRQELNSCENLDILSILLNKKLPLVGFGTRQSGDELWNKTLKNSLVLLNNLGLNQKSFLMREAPDISEEGSDREAVIEVKNFHYSMKKDAVGVSFELPKGSYATVVLKQIFRR